MLNKVVGQIVCTKKNERKTTLHTCSCEIYTCRPLHRIVPVKSDGYDSQKEHADLILLFFGWKKWKSCKNHGTENFQQNSSKIYVPRYSQHFKNEVMFVSVEKFV
jgi:hypothetical protein